MLEYPFLTLLECHSREHIGIVSNKAATQVSMYLYDRIGDSRLKSLFLSLGEKWWWETNRQIPIGIVFRRDMRPFERCMGRFPTRGSVFKGGPETSLAGLNRKRTKRRNLQLEIRR